MSYEDNKRERAAALIQSIHGGEDGRTKPGLPPIEINQYRSRPLVYVKPDEPDEPGWGSEIAVDSSLFWGKQ